MFSDPAAALKPALPTLLRGGVDTALPAEAAAAPTGKEAEMFGSLLVLFLTVLVGGGFPKLFRCCTGSVISVLNAACGGFFLALPLAHIIPEAAAEVAATALGLELTEAQTESLEEATRWLGVVVFTGYVFVLACEHVVAKWAVLCCTFRARGKNAGRRAGSCGGKGADERPLVAGVRAGDFSDDDGASTSSAASQLRPSTEIFLAVALGVHAVAEGFYLADGLFGADRKGRNFVFMLCFFVVDKFLEGLALGLRILRKETTGQRVPNWYFCALLAIQALASPLGFFLRSLVGEPAEGAGYATLTSRVNLLTAGMLLYVSCTEIIPEVFEEGEEEDEGRQGTSELRKASAVLVRFALFVAAGYGAIAFFGLED